MVCSLHTATGIYGRVALISLKYDKNIYLIPVSLHPLFNWLVAHHRIQTLSYIQEDGFLKLPHSLLVFFRSPHIQKVSIHVKADLTCHFRDCGFKDSDEPFTGAVKLSLMAKQHNFADRANISLTDLTAIVLHHYLSKDPHICISTARDNCELTLGQETYVALDVYAGAAILESFDGIPVGTPVSLSTPGRTCVKLLSCD